MEDTHSILARLDERTLHMSENAKDILEQLKKLNSKVAHHEKEIQEIKIDFAKASGSWSGIRKTLAVVLTIAGIAIGAAATMLWH